MSRRLAEVAAATALLTIAASVAAQSPLPDALFLTESHHAMDRMMTGMGSPPSGDADRDFATMMIPHHQGAIDMAVAELKFGHDSRLRRIAQGIIVEQQQEITAMRNAIAVGSTPAPGASAMPMPMADGRTMR